MWKQSQLILVTNLRKTFRLNICFLENRNMWSPFKALNSKTRLSPIHATYTSLSLFFPLFCSSLTVKFDKKQTRFQEINWYLDSTESSWTFPGIRLNIPPESSRTFPGTFNNIPRIFSNIPGIFSSIPPNL